MADSGDAIQMIAGLGNPGEKYARTRHNVGFWFLNALAQHLGASFKTASSFQADVAIHTTVNGSSLRLLRPNTHVNVSGLPIAAACRYYRLPMSQLLVVQDDIDLPEGSMRLKFNGGHGGHNGIRDLQEHAGRDFWRLKFGVGHPGQASKVVDYVLHPLPLAQYERMQALIADSLRHLDALLAGDFQTAMNALHPAGKVNA